MKNMTDEPIKNERRSPRLLLNSHFFAKIALIVSALCVLGLILVFVFVASKTGGSYGAISRAFSLSQQNLGPTMLIAGLFMVAFAGFITWLFALYTSHYIAGPLYGFSRNFQAMIEQGAATPTPMRENDQLKREEQHIKRSITKLQQHYDEIRNAAESALFQMNVTSTAHAPTQATNAPPLVSPTAAIAKLKELDLAARL